MADPPFCHPNTFHPRSIHPDYDTPDTNLISPASSSIQHKSATPSSISSTIKSLPSLSCEQDITEMSMLLINIRSLQTKMHILRSLVLSSNYDVIFITETWLTACTPDSSFTLVGYKVFSNPRLNRRGGGCLIFCKDSLPATRMQHPVLEAVEDSVWITLKLQSQELLLGCIYRTPQSSSNDFIPIINAFNLATDLPIGHKLIAGDFNTPGVCWSSFTGPRYSLDFVTCTNVCGWSQHVKLPTRGNNILDLLFTHGLTRVVTAVGDALPGCDHRAITCTFSVPKLIDSNCHPTQQLYTSVNWSNFECTLRSLSWDTFFLQHDPQLAADTLYTNLSTCLSLVTTTRANHNYARISALTKMQNKYLELQKAHKKTLDFSILLQLHRLAAQIRLKTEYSLRKQEASALESHDRCSKLAHLLKSRTQSKTTGISYLTLENNLQISSPQAISEAFNSYFASSLTKDSSSVTPLLPTSSSNTLSTVLFHVKDIARLLNSFRASLRSGPDGLPSAVFLNGGPDIPFLLLNLYNLSMMSGTFPSQWKMSIIIPHHKKGPVNAPANYRPINHTPVIARLMEKIVKDSIAQHLFDSNLLHPSQHGFLRSRSCMTCQVEFLDFITTAADNGYACIILLLDLSKAFDRVPHSRLLAKVRSFGIRAPLLSWLTSYLSMRTQTVSYEGHSSQAVPVTSGVIQGSVLGPLLFLMYINDAFDSIAHGKPFVFADDIKLVYTFKPDAISSVLNNITTDLQCFVSWCQRWSMTISAEKSVVLAYKCQIPSDSLTINNMPLNCKPIVRDLGVSYSPSFNFSEHASLQVSRARRSVGLVLRSFRLRRSILLVYKSHVRPLLEYGSIVFSNMRKVDRVSIENVQRRFTKHLVGYASPLNYEQRCKLLQIEPLWLRRLKINLIFLHNLIHKRSIISPQILQFKIEPPYLLRNMENILSTSRTRSTLRSNFFIPKYSHLWNSLPSHIRLITSVTIFKSALNKFLTVDNAFAITGISRTTVEVFENGLDF